MQSRALTQAGSSVNTGGLPKREARGSPPKGETEEEESLRLSMGSEMPSLADFPFRIVLLL